jgi:hypothetical protein
VSYTLSYTYQAFSYNTFSLINKPNFCFV